MTLAAVVLLLWLAASLVAQIVSTSLHGFNQWFAFGSISDPLSRIRAVSVTSGITVGIQLGVALGLIEHVVRALVQVRSLAIGDEDGVEAENTDWLGPTTD